MTLCILQCNILYTYSAAFISRIQWQWQGVLTTLPFRLFSRFQGDMIIGGSHNKCWPSISSYIYMRAHAIGVRYKYNVKTDHRYIKFLHVKDISFSLHTWNKLVSDCLLRGGWLIHGSSRASFLCVANMALTARSHSSSTISNIVRTERPSQSETWPPWSDNRFIACTEIKNRINIIQNSKPKHTLRYVEFKRRKIWRYHLQFRQ